MEFRNTTFSLQATHLKYLGAHCSRKRLKKVHMERQPKESGVTVLATDDLIFKVRNSARGKEETPTAKGISPLGNINKQTSK